MTLKLRPKLKNYLKILFAGSGYPFNSYKYQNNDGNLLKINTDSMKISKQLIFEGQCKKF